jgi:ubiquinone/menaquinone biosynthesis C-methylase UbiE
MPQHTCPWWAGYFLTFRLRCLVENPRAILAPHVRNGMLVLEPGPGMGFFTLELARLVGPHGRVVAVDVQERMLSGLRRRAARAGLVDRLDLRLAAAPDLGIEDLAGSMDFALIFHMLHEVPDQKALLAGVHAALRPGGTMLLVEPRGHVSRVDFAASLATCREVGLVDAAGKERERPLHALLLKPATPS